MAHHVRVLVAAIAVALLGSPAFAAQPKAAKKAAKEKPAATAPAAETKAKPAATSTPAESRQEEEAAPRSESGSSDPKALRTGFSTMENQISLFGLGSYYYQFTGWGLGARYQKILVPRGWLHTDRIHDEFGLEGGIDYIHYRWNAFGDHFSYNEYAFVVGGVWNLWLTRNFAVYPKLDVGVAFGSWSGLNGIHHPSTGGVVWDLAAGLVYKFDAGVCLRAEAGTGYARLGASYAFF